MGRWMEKGSQNKSIWWFASHRVKHQKTKKSIRRVQSVFILCCNLTNGLCYINCIWYIMKLFSYQGETECRRFKKNFDSLDVANCFAMRFVALVSNSDSKLFGKVTKYPYRLIWLSICFDWEKLFKNFSSSSAIKKGFIS